MATHFCYCVWEIPWTEEPSRLQSPGSQRIKLNLVAEEQQGGWSVCVCVCVCVFVLSGEWPEKQNMANIASISITPLLASMWGHTVEFLIPWCGQELSYMAYCDLRVICLEVNVILDNLKFLSLVSWTEYCSGQYNSILYQSCWSIWVCILLSNMFFR